VQNYTGKIITRGVFVDLAAHRGVDTRTRLRHHRRRPRRVPFAAIATDTWGIELLHNEIDVWQPLHVLLDDGRVDWTAADAYIREAGLRSGCPRVPGEFSECSSSTGCCR
jgi:hypothetical protein